MRILVACIGNVFLGDDGFGPAVAERLLARAWPSGVEVGDYGIRGMDLAFALTSGIDAAILVDAVKRGGEPGTLYLIEPSAPGGPAAIQTHAMDPASVLALGASIGALPGHVRVVGCEPERLDDDGDVQVGLSERVSAALDDAVRMVERAVQEASCTS